MTDPLTLFFFLFLFMAIQAATTAWLVMVANRLDDAVNELKKKENPNG